MQTPLIKHFVHEYLNNFFEELAYKHGVAPVGAVLRNFLRFTPDESGATRLETVASNLVDIVEQFQKLPDDVAYENTDVAA